MGECSISSLGRSEGLREEECICSRLPHECGGEDEEESEEEGVESGHVVLKVAKGEDLPVLLVTGL